MSYVTTEERVDRLEAVFGQFMTEMALLNKRADERNKAAEERNRLAEERMSQFENEMRAFKDEMRQSKRELDKKWGDLANKMGTIVEDILAPNLRRLAREHFGLEPVELFATRLARSCPAQPARQAEYDVLVVSPTVVILGEARSTPRPQDAEEVAEKLRTFFEFFPEYRGRRLLGLLGSWAMSETVVTALTARGVYAMCMGEDTMELVNAAALEGRGKGKPKGRK
ncbi:MAG TPA: hypothetical protein VI136_26875 [Verrucomicrobiae bacterium]